jgi:hypothetical protein
MVGENSGVSKARCGELPVGLLFLNGGNSFGGTLHSIQIRILNYMRGV